MSNFGLKSVPSLLSRKFLVTPSSKLLISWLDMALKNVFLTSRDPFQLKNHFHDKIGLKFFLFLSIFFSIQWGWSLPVRNL